MNFAWLRKAATLLALIIAVTAATRFAFAVYEMGRIPSPALERVAFDTEVGSIARSLASGEGFSSPYNRETGATAILPPVYPLLVAGVFKIFGIQSAQSFRALLSLNIFFAALTCIPIYKVGETIGGRSLGAAATWLWALFPNGIVIPFEWIWETALSALLAATLLWLTIQLAQAPSLRRWIVYSLVWGVALMTNPALGAALPVLLFWAAWRAHKLDPETWRNAALAFVLALICCAPWTIRNYAVFHRFIPLRSGFGFELYIGNNENYAEPRVWPPRVSYEREVLRYIHIGEVPFMDEEMRKAVAFMRQNPGIALRLCANRIVDFWIGTAAPLQALRRDAPSLDRFIVLCNILVPPLLLAGCVRLAAARSPFLLPLAALPVFYPLVYYITHTSLRYRHPIDACAFLLVCAAFVSWRQPRNLNMPRPEPKPHQPRAA